MATFAKTPPGSGANFAKLKGALASRGASDPGALAAWIGRKKYGRKGMAKLSAHAHSNVLGFTSSEEGGMAPGAYSHSHVVTHVHDVAEPAHTHDGMGPGYTPRGDMRSGSDTAAGTTLDRQPEGLHVRHGAAYAKQAGFQAQRLGVGSRTGNYGSMSNTDGTVVSLAKRTPVTSPWDILVSRGSDGVAQVRHRRGGVDIGQIKRMEDGTWAATPDGGSPLEGRTHQRTALLDLLGTWNRAATVPEQTPAVPYAQPPQQTPLMAKFGVPAVSALATPTTGVSDGPRTTESGSSGGENTDGLTPKGKAIYAKLRGRGFPAERALAFAKRAQNMGGASS